jgi:Ca2+-binding RTX toxin-like protein
MATTACAVPRSRTRSEGSAAKTWFVRLPDQDLILGGSGNDFVFAGRGADTIHGGSQPDGLLYGDRGADTIFGGASGAGRTRLDVIIGAAGSDVLYGGAGRDHIEGRAGSDVMSGGSLGDGLNDGRGADTIHGGLGNDGVLLQGDGTPDIVHCGPGQDVVFGATSGNTVDTNCEEVHVGQP